MLFTDFLKRNIARTDGMFLKPPMTAKGNLILPIGSVYHTSEEGFGPFGLEDDILLAYKGDKTVQNVYGLYPNVEHGGLLYRTFSEDNLYQEFNKNNKQFEVFKSAENRLAKTPKMLHIVNYGNMFHQVTQKEESLQEYHAYLNYWESFFRYLGEFVSNDKRQHFFKIEPPIIVPPKTVLERVENKPEFTVTEVGYFTDQQQMLILEFWRWLDLEDPESYVLSLMSHIPVEHLNRVNVIFSVGTHYAVYNLGLVRGWIKTKDNKRGLWKPQDTQKKFLSLLINLADFRTNTKSADADLEELEAQMPEDDEDDAAFASLDFEKEQAEKMLNEAEFAVEEAKKPKGGFYKKSAQKDLAQSQPNLVGSIRDAISQDEGLEFIADSSLDPAEDPITVDEDKALDEKLEKLEEVQAEAIKSKQIGEYVPYQPESIELGEYVKRKAREVASKGLMTSAELRRFEKLADSWKEIKAPNGQTMEEYLQFDPKDEQIKNDVAIASPMSSVLDETFLLSSLKKMDKVYVEKFFDKHIHQFIINIIQREGIIVKDIKRTHVKTLMDDYYVYSVKVIPVNGKESTLSIKVPRPNSDGTMVARNVKMRMRKQRGDVPIRKLSPVEVAMTSSLCKMFVSRSERVTNNYDKWICKQIYEGTLLEKPTVQDLVYGNVFNPDLRAPRPYTAIAKNYTSFRTGNKGQYHLNFDSRLLDLKALAEHDIKKNEIACGTVEDNILVIDELGILTAVKGKDRTPVGVLESLLGVPEDSKRPVEMIDIGPISGHTIPLGFLLGYYIGLGTLLKTLNVPHRRLNKGQRMNLEDGEVAIRFADQSIIIKTNDKIALALINGFNRYKNEIANHSVWEFDKKDGYEAVFDLYEIRTRHCQRFQQIRRNWVDPITEKLLIRDGYPTDMVWLFIEAARLLEYDDHPEETDIRYSRVKGYERIPGIIYGSVSNALSTMNSRPNNPNNQLTINPEEVWYAITTDQTTAPVDDSNPIQSVKDRSVVVFSGSGGRSGRTMTARSRRFHPSGVGIVSSDTVDSGDVGTITYLSANPNFDTIYGTSGTLENPNDNSSACFSESMLLVPGAKYDDPKRINFLNIQNSSTTHCKGYRLMPCRTGFEKTMAQRSGEMFSATAYGPGVVEFVSKDVIRIAYDDGSTQSFQIGRRYGNWSGKVIPHSIVTKLKVGDKVKENDLIYYNELFFEEDVFSKNGDIAMKWGVLARTVFVEVKETLEDGSGISADFSKQLTTTDCKTKYIDVDFTDEIRNLLPKGSKVNDDSILCTILPPSSEALSQYADQAASVLRRVHADSPRAKFNGVIEQYRVYYCGDISEMSPSLALLAEQSDDEIISFNKRMKEPVSDGQVMLGYRIDGKPIGKNTARIEVRMNGELAMKPGDKLVVGGQMKSIVGEIYEEAPVGEDGRAVDCQFSQAGTFNRMVQSVMLMGAINTTMLRADEEQVKIFFGESD